MCLVYPIKVTALICSGCGHERELVDIGRADAGGIIGVI